MRVCIHNLAVTLYSMDFPVSCWYMIAAVLICLRLLMHRICWAFVLAEESAGSSIAARIAMIAITTRSSIKVKPANEWLSAVLGSTVGFVARPGWVKEFAFMRTALGH